MGPEGPCGAVASRPVSPDAERPGSAVDPGALAQLHGSCFGWALSCCGRDRSAAEDALQTTYLRVLSGQARFEGRSSLKTWLFGVIRRVASEERRRAFFRGLVGLRLRQEPEPAPSPTEAPGADAERARVVAAGLAALSGRQREVLHLVFYEQMSVREAALVMGVSAGAASLHYDRGKRNLMGWLEQRGFER